MGGRSGDRDQDSHDNRFNRGAGQIGSKISINRRQTWT